MAPGLGLGAGGRRWGEAAGVLAAVTWCAAVATFALLATLPLSAAERPTARLAAAAFVLGMSWLAAAGAVLVRHRDHTTMGWLLLGTGLSGVLGRLALGLAIAVGDTSGLLGWITNWAWVPAQALALLLLLRFPTGHRPGPRWRWAEGTVLAWGALTVVATALLPGPLGAEALAPTENPFGVEPLAPVLDAALGVLFGVLPALMVVAVAGPVVRWRTATASERRQLRAVALAAGLLAVAAPLAVVSGAGALLEGLAYVVLPAAIGYAVLRHRLWGIDVARRLDRLRAVREEERRRLQRELHDSIGPVLGSVTMRAETARNLLAGGQTERLDDVLASIGVATEDALMEVRRLIDELGPSALAEQDLVPALERLLDDYADQDVQIALRADRLPELDPEVATVAYRVVGEAVRNLVRHSGARVATVTLHLVEGVLHLEVRDDGHGLRGHPPGVGRRGMEERVRALGGSFSLGEDTRGVVVRAQLPEAVR
jgi:signal transduction histidine kinase